MAHRIKPLLIVHVYVFLAVRCIRNKAAHFATELYKSMKGLGTDDDTLCRVVASRASVDMVQIKQEFQKMYKQTLGMFCAVSVLPVFYIIFKRLKIQTHKQCYKLFLLNLSS